VVCCLFSPALQIQTVAVSYLLDEWTALLCFFIGGNGKRRRWWRDLVALLGGLRATVDGEILRANARGVTTLAYDM